MPEYKLKDGYMWNPFHNFPKNAPCVCGSLQKFKHCCYGKLLRTVPMDKVVDFLDKLKSLGGRKR